MSFESFEMFAGGLRPPDVSFTPPRAGPGWAPITCENFDSVVVPMGGFRWSPGAGGDEYIVNLLLPERTKATVPSLLIQVVAMQSSGTPVRFGPYLVMDQWPVPRDRAIGLHLKRERETP